MSAANPSLASAAPAPRVEYLPLVLGVKRDAIESAGRTLRQYRDHAIDLPFTAYHQSHPLPEDMMPVHWRATGDRMDVAEAGGGNEPEGVRFSIYLCGSAVWIGEACRQLGRWRPAGMDRRPTCLADLSLWAARDLANVPRGAMPLCVNAAGDGVVLQDPFTGSGVTARVAIEHVIASGGLAHHSRHDPRRVQVSTASLVLGGYPDADRFATVRLRNFGA